MKRIVTIPAFLLVTACASAPIPTAIDFYDRCAKTLDSFVDMAACGKKHRNNSCEAHSNCSANGDTIIMYTDSLAKSVVNHEMSESEAQRKWVEFRAGIVNAEAQRAAILAARSPTTCYTNNGVTNCF
jgi:hypothetical protein